MRLRSIAVAAGALALAATLFFMPPAATAQAVSYSTQELEFVRLLNDYRQGLGLQPLMLSDLCSDAAKKHSLDMGTHSFFAHASLASDFFPVGVNAGTRLLLCGYNSTLGWAETIAAGYSMASPVLKAWKASPLHNPYLISPSYRVIGLGLVYVPGSEWGYYWTADFGAHVDTTARWLDEAPPSSTTTTTAPPVSTTTTTAPPPTTSTTESPSTTSTSIPPPVTPTFADVREGHIFYEPITRLAALGVVSGSEGLFRPDDLVARAQFAKIIVLALGRHTEEIDNVGSPSFPDVPYTGTAYPFDFVEEAVGLGIIKGRDDGTFGPAAAVTRAQIALMLVRAGGDGLRLPPAGSICPFADVPAYARAAVTIAHYNGLVSGKTAASFSPYSHATRGQVAKMVYGLHQALHP